MTPNIKLGLIARMDNTGLGNQTWEFYRHLKPDKVLIIDLSTLNECKNYPNRYDSKAKIVYGLPTNQDIDEFLTDVNVVLTAESPYNYYLYQRARERGIRTIVQPNFEFIDYFRDSSLPLPDIFISPSLWHFQDLVDLVGNSAKVIYLPFPVDRKRLSFRKVKKIKSFLHIAGRRLFEDRNGTDLLLEAIPQVKADIKFIIYSSYPLPITDKRIILKKEIKNYWQMYQQDSLILPRRYGGQSLQLNEALSRGMIPLMLECPPQDSFLLKESLVPPTSLKQIFTRMPLECFTTTPEILAHHIDQLVNLPTERIAELSKHSNKLAEQISWDKLKSKYEEIINYG